jgi:hypothetical protein
VLAWRCEFALRPCMTRRFWFVLAGMMSDTRGERASLRQHVTPKHTQLPVYTVTLPAITMQPVTLDMFHMLALRLACLQHPRTHSPARSLARSLRPVARGSLTLLRSGSLPARILQPRGFLMFAASLTLTRCRTPTLCHLSPIPPFRG